MFLISSWPNPCVVTTQGAGWSSRTHPQHMNQTLLVPEPEFSPRSCSGHWASATSLQRLCLIQKAPAKSIPTPDKLFSILASTFHPSGLKKSSQLSPRFPAEPKGRGAVGSRDLSPSAGPQHTLSLSTLSEIPTGWKTGIWERNWECSAVQGVVQPVPNISKHSKALSCQHSFPQARGLGKQEIPLSHGGSDPNCLLLNLSPLSQRFQSFNSRLLCFALEALTEPGTMHRSIPKFIFTAFLTLSQTRGNFLLKCHKSLPGLEQQQVRKGIRGGILIQTCYSLCSRQNKARGYQQFCL